MRNKTKRHIRSIITHACITSFLGKPQKKISETKICCWREKMRNKGTKKSDHTSNSEPGHEQKRKLLYVGSTHRRYLLLLLLLVELFFFCQENGGSFVSQASVVRTSVKSFSGFRGKI